MEENDIMYKTCPICGKDMILIDHDNADGLFAGWEWQCQRKRRKLGRKRLNYE